MHVRFAKIDEAILIFEIDKKNFKNFYLEDFYFKKINEKKILVLEIDEKIIGFILFDFIFDECEIYKIVILEEYRNKNLSRLLMEKFISEMKNKNILKIFLEVRESNIFAIKLYTFFGFKEIRKIKDYYKEPKEDGIVMLKEVDYERY